MSRFSYVLVSLMILVALASCNITLDEWGTPQYSWSDDYKCTASIVNNSDSSLSITETVDGVYSVVTAQTCTTTGEGKYTATFASDKFTAQEKTVEIPKHTYDETCTCTVCHENPYFGVNNDGEVLIRRDGNAKPVPASFSFPSNGTKISGSLFQDDTSITSVTIPVGYTTIGSYAFDRCIGLSCAIVLPSGLVTIEQNAFNACSGITGVTFPSGLQDIGSAAFWGCSSITEVVLPNTVTSIGTSIFGSCSSLESITFSSGLTYGISSYACSGCTSLESVTIPASISIIGEKAFFNCTSLTDIHFGGTRAQWDAVTKFSNWNTGCPGNLTVHCSDD